MQNAEFNIFVLLFVLLYWVKMNKKYAVQLNKMK